MNKKLYLLQFLLVFFFFIIPPLFSKGPAGFSDLPSLSVFHIVQVVLGTGIFIQHKKITGESSLPFRSLYWWAIALGLLMLIFAFLTAISIFLGLNNGSFSAKSVSGVVQWCSIILCLAISAFYEESVYRMYLPESLIFFSGHRKFLSLASELFVLILFAFSHSYLGFISVINAFLCGIVLRLCFIRCRSVFPGFTAHFIYNLFIVFINVMF